MSLPVREVWIEIFVYIFLEGRKVSLPVREVWIEIYCAGNENMLYFVTSRGGECGLKLCYNCI